MRPLSRLTQRPNPTVWWLIGAGVVIRAGYALVADPFAGPDALTYHRAAVDLAAHGVLSDDVRGVPYWPAGYPVLVAAVYELVGVVPRAVTVLQAVVLGAGVWSTYALVRRSFGTDAALLTAGLLTVSPALVDATASLMYEPLLLTGLVVGMDLVSRAAGAVGRRALLLAGGGSLALAATATLQHKVVVAAAGALVWLAITRREWLLPIGCAVVVAAGPGLVAARTYAAHGTFAVSANLGPTLALGLSDEATGTYLVTRFRSCSPSGTVFERDAQLRRCALDWTLEHPGRALALVPAKAYHHWRPVLDLPSRLPDDVRRAGWFTVSYRVASGLWTALTAGAFLAGSALALSRREHRPAAILLLVPVLTFLAVSLVTIGLPRFRLPVAPFHTAFQALALIALVRWRGRRRARLR